MCAAVLFLAACSMVETSNNNEKTDDSSIEKPSNGETDDKQQESSNNSENDKENDKVQATPEPGDVYYFNTYEELKMWFTKDSNSIIPAREVGPRYRDGKWIELSENFDRMVTKISDNEWRVIIPYRNGEAMDDLEGVTVMVDEAYSNPWIWATHKYGKRPEGYKGNKDYITFRYMYLSDELMAEAKDKDIDEFVLFLANGNTKYFLSTGTVKTIELKDKTVSALYSKWEDDTRTYLTFIYDNILIRLVLPDETFMGDFLKEISFSYYK